MPHNPFEIYTHLSNKKRPELSFEEFSIDSAARVEEVVDDRGSFYPFTLIWLFVIVFFLILFSRLFYLQVTHHAAYEYQAENNRLRTVILQASRGFIFDRQGEKIADNIASFNLVATPADLPKEGLKDELDLLNKIIPIDSEAVYEKLKKADRTSFQTLPIKYGMTEDEKLKFEASGSDFLGIGLEAIPIRKYADNYALSHVIGYTGIVSGQEKNSLGEANIHPRDQIGKIGIEKQYDGYLRGVNGVREVQVNSVGSFVADNKFVEPKQGGSAYVTVDASLTKKIYQYFEEQAESIKGAAVVMDAKSGEVLSLVSVPSFPVNDMVAGKAQDGSVISKLFNDESLPLFNRALSGLYPPGSTVKPMIATAALMHGIVTDKTIINDTGIIQIPNQFDPSIVYSFRGWKRSGLGRMDVYDAIAQSSDIFFYAIAGGLPGSNQKSLGAFGVAAALREYNFGKSTSIDLPNEKLGVVPDPDWKKEYFKEDPIKGKWYVGDTYHLGIGQGDLLVTPLQLALATSVVANNGVAMKPFVVSRVVATDGSVIYTRNPEVMFKHPASREVFKIAQGGMRQTVVSSSGSAHQLADLPIACFGKTGTSQFDGSNPDKTHAWFTAYCPFGDTEIVIVVLVEAGGDGHSAAVPIVKKTIEWLYENRFKK